MDDDRVVGLFGARVDGRTSDGGARPAAETAWLNQGGTGAHGSIRVTLVPHTPPDLPAFTRWPSFPFEGEFRVKKLDDPVDVEPPRKGEGDRECLSCAAPDEAYIWVSERWRVRAPDRPSGLPVVLILESRSHLDLGDLPNLLAAELGVMTVRLERAIRSLDGVARVHVNRWGDGLAHLHIWFLARPYGRLQLRGTFLSLWEDILPPIPEAKWRENLALVAAWLAEFGGRALAEPPHIEWQAPSSLAQQNAQLAGTATPEEAAPAEDQPLPVSPDNGHGNGNGGEDGNGDDVDSAAGQPADKPTATEASEAATAESGANQPKSETTTEEGPVGR